MIIYVAYAISVMTGFVKFSYLSIPGIVVVVMSAFSISMFIFSLSDNIESQALLLFVVTIVMMFVSGNIIPEVFLPDIVRKIGKFMPGKYIAQLMGQIISGQIIPSEIIRCLLYGTIFLALSTIVLHISEAGKE